jgi:hypothetical protein
MGAQRRRLSLTNLANGDSRVSSPHTVLGRGFSEGVFVDIKKFFPEGTDVPAAKIVQDLLQNPYDLIDIFRLMRRFRASGADAQRALGVFEQLNPGTEELPSDVRS